jgi:hypothetical protein
MDAPPCEKATSNTDCPKSKEEIGKSDGQRSCVVLWYRAGFVLPSLGH